jgi:phospholipid/cholesterol/gamma-HCH transport system ATP-binding protein
MRKRVAIARSIAMSPKYLFYDEPTTGLDPIMSDVINDLIVDLHQKLKQTGVVITHDMQSAYKISSRIAMLYEGKIVKIDTPEAIKNSADPVVHQFVTGSAQGPIQMKVRAYD